MSRPDHPNTDMPTLREIFDGIVADITRMNKEQKMSTDPYHYATREPISHAEAVIAREIEKNPMRCKIPHIHRHREWLRDALIAYAAQHGLAAEQRRDMRAPGYFFVRHAVYPSLRRHTGLSTSIERYPSSFTNMREYLRGYRLGIVNAKRPNSATEWMFRGHGDGLDVWFHEQLTK
jgi:hypothetical protein